MFTESKDYDVTITIKLRTSIEFAPIERETRLTHLDAIGNAVGSMPADVFEALMNGFGGEFSPATMSYEAVERD